MMPHRHYRRRRLVKMQDRSQADASLSHDGDYAIAVCQVLDEVADTDAECIVDSGEGPALHEPEHGDKGFLDPLTDDLELRAIDG